MRTFKVLWSKRAEKDLESIIDFIAFEKPETALKVLHRIRIKAVSLRKNPNRGRSLPELRHISALPFKELLISPWRLIYRIQGKVVQVLSILDGRRDLEDILFERLTEP